MTQDGFPFYVAPFVTRDGSCDLVLPPGCRNVWNRDFLGFFFRSRG